MFNRVQLISLFTLILMLKSIAFTRTLGVRLLSDKKLVPRSVGNFTSTLGNKDKASNMGVNKIKYPLARRDENAVDKYHGIEVPDPYRWLEDPDFEETKKFVDAQNAITTPYLNACPNKATIFNNLQQLWDYPKYSTPDKHGDKYYMSMNSGIQNQNVLYVQDSLQSEPRVFFDPNLLSEDGTVSIRTSRFSEDGSIFAYTLSQSGSDWSPIHFMDTKTGKKYPEVLHKVKFSGISWTHDNKGIFYSCYESASENDDGSTTSLLKDQVLKYHKIGTSQEEDIVVVDYPEDPLMMIEGHVTDCGKWLIVFLDKDIDKNIVFFSKLPSEITGKLSLTQIVKKFEANWDYIGNDGSKAIFKTNKDAPNDRILSINLENYQDDSWEVLVPEHPRNAMEWAEVVDNDKLVLCYLEDVKNVLVVHSLQTGKFLKQIPLEVGSIAQFTGNKKYSEIFYKVTSFLTPGTIYRIDFKDADQTPTVIREIKLKNFDPSAYNTTQVFYESKDGTKIPMFIVHKKDAKLDGSMPALLYGYGGFKLSLSPDFSVVRLCYIQSFDGLLAIPNIRGGGEYGDKWHKSGILLKKQNSIDDFIAAAEYLIRNGYTSKEKLTIQGGSNGGFLVGACANQRPDLFGAVIAEVGVMDLLKYSKFTIGHFWVSDYGSPDDPEQFQNLLKLSPLHNIRIPKDGGQYPAMLLTTADHDDRVVPLHSLKCIAQLQHVLGNHPAQKNPLLIRVVVKAGHGAGKPTHKQIEEKVDILAFIQQALNLEFKA